MKREEQITANRGRLYTVLPAFLLHHIPSGVHQGQSGAGRLSWPFFSNQTRLITSSTGRVRLEAGDDGFLASCSQRSQHGKVRVDQGAGNEEAEGTHLPSTKVRSTAECVDTA